jgi:hypothetical protein
LLAKLGGSVVAPSTTPARLARVDVAEPGRPSVVLGVLAAEVGRPLDSAVLGARSRPAE